MFGLVCCEFGWGFLFLAWCVVSLGEGFLFLAWCVVSLGEGFCVIVDFSVLLFRQEKHLSPSPFMERG